MSHLLKFETITIKRVKRALLDSAFVLLEKEKNNISSDNLARGKNKSRLFSRGRISEHFFTEDSKLYITPREQKLMEQGLALNREIKNWDSLSSRVVGNYQLYRPSSEDILTRSLRRKYRDLKRNIGDGSRSIINQWSLVKLWNFSLIGAIILGMFSMTLIYRLLGPGALAGKVVDKEQSSGIIQTAEPVPDNQKVLGAMAMKGDVEAKDISEYIEKIAIDLENSKKEEFEKKIRRMVRGYPIEKMIPDILEKDRIVAAFLIGIAKKESNWGKRVPVLDGQDCYNYWGYRGKRKLMGTGGHTCFNSRKDAVDTVAKRLEWLMKNQNRNTPDKMVIWKCGSACHKDNQEAVRKWISDVNLYFDKLDN